MKTNLLSLFICLFCLSAFAQNDVESTTRTTFYENFQSASILLTDGKTIKQKYANIFLKNGMLLYKNNAAIMQADMSNIKSVQFSDRTYIRIDSLLAYVVDTLNNNKLLCATLIDIDAYKTQILNNRQITNLELGNHVNVSAIGNTEAENQQYPLVNNFYFDVDGKIIKAHERIVQRTLPKDKLHIYKTIIQSPQFSWSDEECLSKLLGLFSYNAHYDK